MFAQSGYHLGAFSLGGDDLVDHFPNLSISIFQPHSLAQVHQQLGRLHQILGRTLPEQLASPLAGLTWVLREFSQVFFTSGGGRLRLALTTLFGDQFLARSQLLPRPLSRRHRPTRFLDLLA